MIRYLLILALLINLSIVNKTIAQEFVKTDSMTFLKVEHLNLKFELLDSTNSDCILTPPKYSLGSKQLCKSLYGADYPPYKDSTDLVKGVVNVFFTIDKNGIAKDVVIKNSLNDFIERNLKEKIAKLKKFEPVKCNKEVIEIRINYDVTYTY